MKNPIIVPLLIIISMMLVATNPSKAADFNDVVRVNNFWNANIKYIEDNAVHGRDHWQGPGDTWARKTGDCDDYAVAKYYTLLALGVPEKNLKLAGVLHDNGTYSPGLHLVVLLTDDRGAWVLDNADKEIALLSQRPDIISTLVVFDKSGVKWFIPQPKTTRTPAMWVAMQANQAKHIAAARAAYNSRRIVVTWIR